MDPLLDRLLDPAILALLIPLSAIVGGVSIALAKLIVQHRERMAKIEHGINPDLVQEKPGHAEPFSRH